LEQEKKSTTGNRLLVDSHPTVPHHFLFRSDADKKNSCERRETGQESLFRLGLEKTRLALASAPLSCSPAHFHFRPSTSIPSLPESHPGLSLSGKKEKHPRSPDPPPLGPTDRQRLPSLPKDYTRLTQLGCCVTASINIHLPRHPSDFLVFLLLMFFSPTPKQKTTTTP
jgi:hypothetical protein